uniref:Uncharacterized protein n=1 Tax=viral metagenome TaxID=1070528 RepID=A0A6M3XW40_9ZZZZ
MSTNEPAPRDLTQDESVPRTCETCDRGPCAVRETIKAGDGMFYDRDNDAWIHLDASEFHCNHHTAEPAPRDLTQDESVPKPPEGYDSWLLWCGANIDLSSMVNLEHQYNAPVPVLDYARAELSTLRAERDNLIVEQERLRHNIADIAAERDELRRRQSFLDAAPDTSDPDDERAWAAFYVRACAERDALKNEVERLKGEHENEIRFWELDRDKYREQCNRVSSIHKDEFWIWQDDDEDHPESLGCPVLMRPETVRRFVAAESELTRLRKIAAWAALARERAEHYISAYNALDKEATDATDTPK